MIPDLFQETVMWSGATSKAITDGTPVQSDVIDLRQKRVTAMLLKTTGGASHDGTGTLFYLYPCNADGTAVYGDTGDVMWSGITAATAAGAAKYTGAAPYMTSGTTKLPLYFRPSYAKLVTINGDIDKTVTVECVLECEM